MTTSKLFGLGHYSPSPAYLSPDKCSHLSHLLPTCSAPCPWHRPKSNPLQVSAQLLPLPGNALPALPHASHSSGDSSCEVIFRVSVSLLHFLGPNVSPHSSSSLRGPSHPPSKNGPQLHQHFSAWHSWPSGLDNPSLRALSCAL